MNDSTTNEFLKYFHFDANALTMDKHSKILEDKLLGPLVIAAFQECIATENFDGFKVLCLLQISRFNLFAQA